MSKPKVKTMFMDRSHRQWSDNECRAMFNAALLKLVSDAGGFIRISMSDVFRVAQNGEGTLAMTLDEDNILTLTKLRYP